MGTERQPLLSTSPLVALVNPSTSPLVMMALFLLLSLATAVLAAPSPMADYVYDGSDAEFEDFDNLTMSRAAEERAINTCNCATEHPGVYARVQGFLPWIKKIIADGEC